MAKNGDKPQRVADLSRELGVDPALLSEFGPLCTLVYCNDELCRLTNNREADCYVT